MDDDFEFFYPVIIEEQLDFEGHSHPKEVFLEGHIIHSGRLLCGGIREVIKNQCKATKERVSKKRIEKTNLCPECTRLYMKNGRSAYYAWTAGKPKVPATKLPPLLKF